MTRPVTIDPLADRVAAVLDGEIGLERVDVLGSEDRCPELDEFWIGVVQILRRMP